MPAVELRTVVGLDVVCGSFVVVGIGIAVNSDGLVDVGLVVGFDSVVEKLELVEVRVISSVEVRIDVLAVIEVTSVFPVVVRGSGSKAQSQGGLYSGSTLQSEFVGWTHVLS